MINNYVIQSILMILFTTQIIKTYLDIFPDRKKIPLKWSIPAWGTYIIFQIWVMYSSANDPLLVMFLTLILFFILCKLFCRTNIRSAMFRAGILYAVWMLMEVAVNYILGKMGLLLLSSEFIIGNTISKIFMYMTVHILKRYRKKEPLYNIPLQDWLRLFLIPLITVYLIHNVYMLTYGDEKNIFFLVTTMLMVLINYITFDMYDQLGKKMETEQKNLVYEQQLSLCNKQAAEREAAYQESRLVRHDLNQYLLDLKVSVESGENQEAAKKIDLILEKNRVYRNEVSRSGNLVVDSLLNYKYSLAIAQGIPMKCQIEIPEVLPIEGADLSIILGNLIDNALEAVAKVPKEKAYVYVSIRQIKGSLSIIIENPYAGKVVKDDQKKILTGKKDNKNHGLGLLSVQRTVEKYKGEMMVDNKHRVFRVEILL